MEIGIAEQEDLAQIAFLENAIEGAGAASLSTLQRRRQMFGEGFLVAKQGPTVVGYIETCLWDRAIPRFQPEPDFFFNEHKPSGPNLYIIFVGVDERYRRHGLGSELVLRACSVARNLSMTRVQAVSGDRLIPFYEGLGFVAARVLPSFLPDGRSYTLMERYPKIE